ncbi:acyltransferase [Bacillus sp. DNRA2]|uniref:acyltransferase family protein n=1 Tax=Bacillus sp. DNRA2 TaxID=2723053 RepID=UPI00145DFFF2|nr:acyltransferase [Bacillus sp. DNRA2]NMD70855.1 acyltransferase [Bacillus sp. DNRA2]
MKDHSKRKHLNLIQFSRALVPLFVLLFHAEAFMHIYFDYDFLKLQDVPKSGGVYYFFALSGFMIYYIYQSDFGNPKKLRDFLVSRFIRIYPIYWILSLCVLPVYFMYPSFGQGNEHELNTIITSFLLFPNENEPILSVAWSLVYTVFFYLVFGINFIKNKTVSRLVLLSWALVSLGFSAKFFTSAKYYINFLFNGNNLVFLVGVLCAFIVMKIKLPRLVAWSIVIIGIFGFPFAWFNTQYQLSHLSLQFITSLASGLLILGLSSIDLQSEINIPTFAKYLGDASFSIYLTHFLIMSVLCKFFSSTSILAGHYFFISVLLLCVATIGGCFVYTFLEKPLNRSIKAFRSKRAFRVNGNELPVVERT